MYRLAGYGLLCIALVVAGAKGGMVYVQSQWNEQKATDAEAHKDMVIKYAEEITRKGEERDTNQGIIDSLAVAARGRVRVQFPTCPATSKGNKDGASRIFSERLERGFARLSERNTERLRRCEQLNADAIEAN